MRRADRLFQIIQILRRRHVVTAARLAEDLEVSERTIYRDVSDLIRSGVPIEGEAGVGYVLRRGFDLPPLMFTAEEIEAMVLGARIVSSWGDGDLARAAGEALARVESVLPDHLRNRLLDTRLYAPGFHVKPQAIAELAPLREAIEQSRKVYLEYRTPDGTETTRVIRPLGLFYWGTAWSVTAWCELREDFRDFRLDRMQKVEVLDDRFPEELGKRLDDYFEIVRADYYRD